MRGYKNKLAMHIINMDNFDNMARLLSQTDGIFDTVRVCDGGSESEYDVWKLYRRYGCETYLREWDDDMSAQHNELLNHSKKGEWILIMDSDECPSKQLSNKLRHYIGGGYDIYKIPSIMAFYGITDWTPRGLMKAIKSGDQKDRFGKWIFFRNDGNIRFEGTSHYGLPEDVTKSWRHHELIPEPYIHYKEPIDIIRCDVQQAWIKPDFQGVPEEFINEMYQVFGCYPTSIDFINYLIAGELTERQQQFLVVHRDTPMLDRFFQFYFLYFHPEQLEGSELDLSMLHQEPIVLKHLRELGGYKSRASWVTMNGEYGEWLPVLHLPVHPQLNILLKDKSHVLLRRSDDE